VTLTQIAGDHLPAERVAQQSKVPPFENVCRAPRTFFNARWCDGRIFQEPRK